MDTELRHVTFHFIDNSSMKLVWPQQGSDDPHLFAGQVRKSLEAERFIAEVEGQIVIIPMQNVKYFVVSPAADILPHGIIRNAQIIT